MPAHMAAAREGQGLAATAPSITGLLAVAVAGVQVPQRDGWHEIKVGTLAPLGPAVQVDAQTRRAHLAWGQASYCAGTEEAAIFWWRVYAEACRRGLGTPAVHTVILLGDGAEWIWQRARHVLGRKGVEVVEIVDRDHAYAYLWSVGNAVFGTGSAQAADWVEPFKDRLSEQGAAPVLTALAALSPRTDEAAEAVRVATGYVTTHAARMDDPRCVARQFPLGSGAVESTCKTLIAACAKGAGMRWSQAGVQAIARLHAVQRAGRWERFWQSQPQRRPPRVRSQPRPRPAATPQRPKTPTSVAPLAGPPSDAAPAVSSALAPRPRPTPLRHQRPFLPPRTRSA